MARRRDRDANDARQSSLAEGWVVEASDVEVDAVPVVDAEAAPEVPIDGAESEADRAPAAHAQLSNGTMVLLGVIGGLYLAYTWVWFSWAQYLATATGASLSLTTGSVGAVLQLFLYWIAPLAPVLWFISALLLNRGGPIWKLGLWLAIGAALLVPLPYFMWVS